MFPSQFEAVAEQRLWRRLWRLLRRVDLGRCDAVIATGGHQWLDHYVKRENNTLA